MVRLNRARSIGGEANLGRRVARERRARGLSYEGLAKLMTDAGCSIAGSAIFKIEKSDPPRRITVDELVAFAQVFEVSVDNLLTPVEVLDQQRAKELLEEMDDAERAWIEATTHWLRTYAEFFGLVYADKDLYQYVMGHHLSRLGTVLEAPVVEAPSGMPHRYGMKPLRPVLPPLLEPKKGIGVDEQFFNDDAAEFYLRMLKVARGMAITKAGESVEVVDQRTKTKKENTRG